MDEVSRRRTRAIRLKRVTRGNVLPATSSVRGASELQFVDDGSAVMTRQPAPSGIVIEAATGAIVADGLGAPGRILVSDDVRIEKAYGHGTAWADSVSPGEPEIRLMLDRLESAAGGYRDVFPTNNSGNADLAKLDVIPEATVTVDPPAELVTSRASLHRTAADFTVPDIPDA
jgi:hypothetical protein